MSLVQKMKRSEKHDIPWAGPCGEGPQGGITQSMIGRYLSCKERFRILTIEGLQPHPRFSAPMDFGNIWHACEEALADEVAYDDALELCANDLLARYPRDTEDVLHWTGIAQTLFPMYVEHWREHRDVKARTPLLAEQKFDVPYMMPSGRTVRLRGKWDSVDLVEENIWLQENKTKSGIDRAKIMRQLGFDLQTMLYLVALEERLQTDTAQNSLLGQDYGSRAKGVRYNVIRRSAHKTAESMMKKVGEDRRNGRINEWFDRINVTVSEADVSKFKRECLDPVLENLCDDYEWWTDCKRVGLSVFDPKRGLRFPDHFPRHFRLPYGIYNPIYEGGFGDVDAYMLDESMAGLQRVTTLFPELEDG